MTIAVDFDGVIHKYSKGWGDGTIYDGAVHKAIPAVAYLLTLDAVFIHTSRRPKQVAAWIEKQSGYAIECTTRLPRKWYGPVQHFWNTRNVLLVTDRKFPAKVYIDDRAIRFTSWEDALTQLKIVT